MGKTRMRKMTKKDREAEASLSKPAAKLLARLRQGRFYRPYTGPVPKAMEELEEKGLVAMCGRVVTIELCYVPAHGYQPFQTEAFAEAPDGA
jgi:hypothetical protein